MLQISKDEVTRARDDKRSVRIKIRYISKRWSRLKCFAKEGPPDKGSCLSNPVICTIGTRTQLTLGQVKDQISSGFELEYRTLC